MQPDTTSPTAAYRGQEWHAAREYARSVLVDIFKQHPTEEQLDEIARKVLKATRPPTS